MKFAIIFAAMTLAARAATWDDRMFAADRCRNAGDYNQAVELYGQALAEAGAGRQEALTANNLAALYDELGRSQDALRLYRRSLEVWQRTLPPTAPEISTALNNLGTHFAREHRYRDAAFYYRRALAIEPHPSTLNNLAEMYRAEGRYTEAEKILRQLTKALPATDPTLGAAYNNLGELCRRKGRTAEAANFYLSALEVWDRVLGPNHPYRATTLQNLAKVTAVDENPVPVHTFR